MTAGIHQFVPTFEPGAVGAHVLELQRLIREDLGRPSEIWTEHIHPSLAGQARFFRDFSGSPGDVAVYQMAIGSVVADFLLGRPEPLVLHHHNLTPVRYLNPWDPGATYGVTWGIDQLGHLAARTALGVAVSAYNQADLRAAGFARTAVAPVLVDLDALGADPDPVTLAARERAGAGGGADWLFVGRISANKCQHQLVKALAVYRRLYDPAARLWLVGGVSSDAYATAIRRYAEALGLAGAVHLTGPVTLAALIAHYRSSDVFVCLSQHEGFCIPVLEAMWSGVPVVALAAAAVPETVGPAGVLLGSDRLGSAPAATVAAAVDRILADPSLRDRLVGAGRRRAADFSLERVRPRHAALLTAVTP